MRNILATSSKVLAFQLAYHGIRLTNCTFQSIVMDNPFDVEYIEGIAQQSSGTLDYGVLVATYAEYLSDGLQVPNDRVDAELLRERYDTLLWNCESVNDQKGYVATVKILLDQSRIPYHQMKHN
ncbi:hypothetical protein FXO38_12918 [Capsicum annuum]|uniref:Uncharacterized protein n=1 Tax=Capsicum annuum TaxID=4072 RepID=A0A2G3AKW6_CAPAN|nr:hypothetical protein FXO37_23877 [Capsicum annuum]KAF3658928.1 hypothetical protein FXO38_12918 [Capsicum annuum]PHT94886.1 hypothetical protein T459_02768 [Capsicum annuum]